MTTRNSKPDPFKSISIDVANRQFKQIDDKIKMNRMDRKLVRDAARNSPLRFDQLDHVINRSVHINANLHTIGGASIEKSQRGAGRNEHSVGSQPASLGLAEYTSTQPARRPSSRHNRSLVADSSKAPSILPLPEIVAKERFRYNPVDCNRKYRHTLFREGNLLTSLRKAGEAAGQSRAGITGYLMTNPETSPGGDRVIVNSLERVKTGMVNIRDITKKIQDSLHQSSYSL